MMHRWLELNTLQTDEWNYETEHDSIEWCVSERTHINFILFQTKFSKIEQKCSHGHDNHTISISMHS